MRDAEEYRAALEWLERVEGRGHSVRDACVLLLEGPRHVKSLVRLVRALGAQLRPSPVPAVRHLQPSAPRVPPDRLRSAIAAGVEGALRELSQVSDPEGELGTVLAELEGKRT